MKKFYPLLVLTWLFSALPLAGDEPGPILSPEDIDHMAAHIRALGLQFAEADMEDAEEFNRLGGEVMEQVERLANPRAEGPDALVVFNKLMDFVAYPAPRSIQRIFIKNRMGPDGFGKFFFAVILAELLTRKEQGTANYDGRARKALIKKIDPFLNLVHPRDLELARDFKERLSQITQ
jgi:hypothetical protein